MAYQLTTATKKLLTLKKRIRGVSGGTSASKTISILMWLIDYAQSTHGELISVVSETLPHLKRGAIRDFLSIMEAQRYYKDSLWNRSDFIYTFESGSKIEFFSVDQPDKVRGPRRDVLFINEANNVPFETYTQLEIRTRKIVWCDWNPVSEFWWYTDVAPFTDHDFITLTYKDNEALEPSIVESIESKRHNKSWWTVYGEGKLGEVEGRIYIGWEQLEDLPKEARLEVAGLDFGYTNDPTAIVDIYKWNDALIFDERAYQKGLLNADIAKLLNDMSVPIIADSAEPKSIDELAMYGLPMIPATKGAGSILQGIQAVQGRRVYVTKRSTNVIKEYRAYLWETDVNGKTLNKPSPINNHAMDAIRYGVSYLFPPIPEDEEIIDTRPVGTYRRNPIALQEPIPLLASLEESDGDWGGYEYTE